MTGPGVEQSIIGPKKTKDCSKPSSCMFPGFSSPDNRGPRACAELIGIGSRFNWFPSLMIVILVATQKPEPLICSVEVHQPLVSQSKRAGEGSWCSHPCHLSAAISFRPVEIITVQSMGGPPNALFVCARGNRFLDWHLDRGTLNVLRSRNGRKHWRSKRANKGSER